MNRDLAPVWACPNDGHPLRAAAHSLGCTFCQRDFPIVDDIPCFATWEHTADPQKFERDRRDRLLIHDADRRLRYDERVELEAVMARLRLGPGDCVLDAGCGVGRITYPLLATGATVVAVDFSLARLQYLRRHAPAAGRLIPVLADVTCLPLAPVQFSAAISTQVLEHIPPPQGRRDLLAGLYRCLRPGGALVLTVYNFNQAVRHRGEPAEGLHDTGIFYHCYEAAELRRELGDFEIAEVCGIVNRLPYTYRPFPYLGPAARLLDHAAEKRPRLSHKWGHLLLAHARRPTADSFSSQRPQPAYR